MATKTTKTWTVQRGRQMKTITVPDGIELFFNNEDGFIRWMEEHPCGYIFNCMQVWKGELVIPYELHRSRNQSHQERLCPLFRSAYTRGGGVPHFTDTEQCKLVSDDRELLESFVREYLAEYGYEFSPCPRCN